MEKTEKEKRFLNNSCIPQSSLDASTKFQTIIIMAHPVVVDDELSASPFFLRSLWLTMNNQNSEARHLL